MITAPVTKVLQVASMPKKMIPLAIVAITSAPKKAPITVPLPPERGPADDHGGDDGEQELASRVGVDRAELAHGEDARQAADGTHHHQHEDARPGERDAREAGGFRVAADRLTRSRSVSAGTRSAG